MDCGDCIDRLYAFLDTELSAEELAQVRAHLDDCGDCDDEFVFEAAFLARLRECCTSDAAPAELRLRVIERVRGDTPPLS